MDVERIEQPASAPGFLQAPTLRNLNEQARYDAWWRSGPGAPCRLCTEGEGSHAVALREQGASYYPMHNFGPDRASVPVRYLLVAMEPSEHGFDDRLSAGMNPEDARNFGGSSVKSADGALQFAVQSWLCDADETFVLTDMAKCAVRDPRQEPRDRRDYRWTMCAPFLRQEVGLFELRAVIAVGGEVKSAIAQYAWLGHVRRFRVVHWAARSANVQELLRSADEQEVSEATVQAYCDFMNERRAAGGKGAKAYKVSRSLRSLLTAYRLQFTCIKRAVTDTEYTCGRRADGTCCKAVPETGL